MGKRHPNPRLVKIHRSYTVDEVANLFDVHRNTVRNWVKQGLSACDDIRPMLLLGKDLVAFLQAKRTKNKRTCGPGQFYCMRCREPRSAAGNMADYEPVTATQGNLVALCACCETLIYRRVSRARLDLVRGDLDITMLKAQEHISESASPSLNSDFAQELRP